MDIYPSHLRKLISELKLLPGIGLRSAERIAFHLLSRPDSEAKRLAEAIVEARERIGYCRRCFNFSEGELCAVCRNTRRDAGTICVVEHPTDIIAIEKTHGFGGLYHVISGKISPLDGIEAGDLKIPQLVERVRKERPEEIILATSSDVEGEATSLYIARALRGLVGRVSRIAHGIPVGSSLNFADEITLVRALEGRREF